MNGSAAERSRGNSKESSIRAAHRPFAAVYTPQDGGRGSSSGKEALRSTAPRVLKLALPHRKLLGLGLLALSLGSGINLLFPFLIRAVLNEQYGLVLERDLSLITMLLIALFAIQSSFFYLRHYAFSVAGYRIITALRDGLFSAIMKQDVAFFDGTRLGDLLSRLSSDTELVQRALTINVSVALRYLIQVIGGLFLMLYISTKLTLVLIALLPLMVAASMVWGRKLKVLSRSLQAQLGDSTVVAEEAISGVRTVRLFAGEDYERNRFKQAINAALDTGTARSRVAAFFSSAMVFLMHSAIAVMIWYGGILVLHNELSLGDLTGFLLYCVIVAVSFGFLANTWVEFMQAIGAAERIYEVMDREPLVRPAAAPKRLPDTADINVSFEAVNFAYPSRPDQLVLKEITFEIPAGKTVALVGPSGGGKSTIAALIPRFYDPLAGQIRFGGVPLPELDSAQLRDLISVVPQQPQVFSVSIGENIAYGRIGATKEEIEAAAIAANIHPFISSLPQGYDTPVGDKGVQLSGGERQRVAIARAILKNPRFLILDEATSALDSENEHLVQSALERLMQGRTTLVIAHRLSTVQHADQVLVIEDGEIKQRGRHQELVSSPGLYQTLVQHQLLG